MVAVHTLEVLPSVEELNDAVGRAFLARLSTLINDAGGGSRVDLAISGGAITTSLFVRMPTSDVSAPGAGSLDDATAAFAATWAELMGERSFDIALIGMGPDGHICSLFPGRVDMNEASPILAIRNSPKPPPQRITVSMPVMRACGEVWLTTAGSAKADALGRAFAGASPLDIPVAGVLAPTTRVYLDEAAAANIATLAP